LSDLHRSALDPVGSAELLAALESDRARWPTRDCRRQPAWSHTGRFVIPPLP